MRYPRTLPDTPAARRWWEGAYKYFQENKTKVGYPPFTAPNGEVFDLHYSSNQTKVNPEKGTGLKLRPKSQQKKDSQVRGDSLKQQTYGNTSLADTPTPEGFNDHHMRPRGVYQVFFDGLDEADSRELSRYSEQELMTPLGDHPGNNARIPDAVHDSHHAFARKHPGLERGLTDQIKGMTLEQRKQALSLYLEQIQPALDEDLFSRMQTYNRSLGLPKLNPVIDRLLSAPTTPFELVDSATDLNPGVRLAKDLVQAANPQLDIKQDFDDTVAEVKDLTSKGINELQYMGQRLMQGKLPYTP